MSNILVVCAHCDDEILGAYCYIKKAVEKGDNVFVCCMTSYSDVREEDIEEKMKAIHNEIGIAKTYIAPYGASVISEVAHIDKVKFIENVMLDCKCDIVITHSALDLHQDHIDVHRLTIEAVRFYQRRPDQYKDNPIKKVMSMEVICSSLWSSKPFIPNCYINANKDIIEQKIDIVSKYDNVIRQNPHPRSRENIFALSRIRGGAVWM